MTYPSLPIGPKRCSNCFYILDHLESSQCPECGKTFDLQDLSTYTTKPPFVWWTFWLPGFLLSGGGGGMLWAVLVAFYGYTAATTLVMPLAIGALVGYAGKLRFWKRIILAMMAAGMAIGILGGAGLAGGFCASILGACAFLPVLLGALFGKVLREILASSSFSQRDYLRFWILPVIVLLPMVAAVICCNAVKMSPVGRNENVTCSARVDHADGADCDESKRA